MDVQGIKNYKIETCLVCNSNRIRDFGIDPKCYKCNKIFDKKILIDTINYNKMREKHYDDEYFQKWTDDLYATEDFETFKHLLTINKECPNCKVICSKHQNYCRLCGLNLKNKINEKV